MRKIALIFVVLFVFGVRPIHSQGTWVWNNRTHPELHYSTLTTDHFFIHYHQGLREIAEKVARIAEQTYPVLMKQMNVQPFGRTSITITSEDEVMNGYAMPSNQIFIWVSQNDVAGHFGGSEKWLRLVVPHEMQHVVMVNALRSWLGVWNFLDVPSWYLEGTAEFYTESWRVGRSDLSMKVHTYKNSIAKLDPHDDGYAKILYLADILGDSTVAKIAHWRQKPFGYFAFNQAFRASTGTSVEKFDEDWRRAMNTYYYSYRGEKETIPEIGKLIKAPKIRYVSSGMISPDSELTVIAGRTSGAMQYRALYVVTNDSTHHVRQLHSGRFGSAPAWSPDSRVIVIGEYHRGSHGSLIYDIRRIDVKTGHTRWLTHDRRANHPFVSSGGRFVYYIAHPEETTNLYRTATSGGKSEQVTSFMGDIQLSYPALSPDGRWIAFMIQEESGDVNIAVVDTAGQHFRKLTDDSAEDLRPVWAADGKSVVFTSYRNSTPNLYRVDFDTTNSGIVQMTDVYSGVYPVQVIPGDTLILASTLADVDTTRLVAVDPGRTVTNSKLTLKSQFRDWRTTRPTNRLPEINYNLPLPASWTAKRYRFWRHPRYLGSLVLPLPRGIGGFTAWTDDLGKHQLIVAGELNYTFYRDQVFNGLLAIYNSAVWYSFFTVLGMHNTGLSVRSYDGGWLVDYRSGGGIQFRLPFNFGNSLYSNHNLSLTLLGISRNPEGYNLEGKRAIPESGKEGLVSIGYSWLHRKPDARNAYFPSQGWGFNSEFSLTDKSVFGDFTYQKFTLDGFANQRILGPFVLYDRLVFSALSGEYAPQDSLGFYQDFNLNLLGMSSSYIGVPPLLSLTESYALRGSQKILVGDRLLMSNLEIRMPFLPALPVNLFGIQIGRSTLSGFVDYGLVWHRSSTVDETTAGVEIRTTLNFGGNPLLQLAYGAANPVDRWRNHEKSRYYMKMGIVNPF